MNLLVILFSLVVLAASKFNFDVECNYYGDVCPKVNEGFALAAKFLENALDLTQPINIKADYSDYSNDPEWSEDTTGKGNPMTVAVDGTVYPQALFKQLPNSNSKEKLETYDMQLSINGRHKHFFPSQYSTTQSHNENTFLDTVCHEILHGMGMVTSFNLEDSFLSNYKYTTYPDNLVNFTVQLNPFEKHIYTRNGLSIGKWIDAMNRENAKFQKRSTSHALYTEKHSRTVQSITRHAQQRNGLYFRTKYGTKVYLETEYPFRAGTTVSHISSKYNTTTDRLITPRSLNGQGIHDITKKGWKTSPFGKRTLQILTTMGYKLNANPKYENSLAHFNDLKKNIKRNTKYDDSPTHKNPRQKTITKKSSAKKHIKQKPKSKKLPAKKSIKKSPAKPNTSYKPPAIKKKTLYNPTRTPSQRLVKKKAQKSSYYTKKSRTYYTY